MAILEGPMSRREIKAAADVIRKFFGELEHHPNCNSRQNKPCDCYARPRIEANDALEELLAEIERRIP